MGLKESFTEHIIGKATQGYDCPNNTGGFVWYPYPDASWKIVNHDEYMALVNNKPLQVTAFQLNNELCIIDGTRNHLLASFVDLLKNAGVSDALYLDMGNWSYSWYRDTPEALDGTPSEVTIIYNKPNHYLGTNWITFAYVN